MILNKVTESMHRCGNCQYWGGERKPAASRDRAEVPNSNCVSKCIHPKQGGNLKTMDLRADRVIGSSCRFYEPWDQLKS